MFTLSIVITFQDGETVAKARTETFQSLNEAEHCLRLYYQSALFTSTMIHGTYSITKDDRTIEYGRF